jgi:hypothetical protein
VIGAMAQNPEWRDSDIFVVRVFRREGGDLTGVVQHVRSGEKVVFQALESLGEVMAQMIRPPGAGNTDVETVDGGVAGDVG